jgi:hypothetical protein
MLFREQFESCVFMPDSVIDDNRDDPLRLYLLLRYQCPDTGTWLSSAIMLLLQVTDKSI